MSSGKRLAKRSIVGTRVVVPSLSYAAEGLFEPAIIKSVRTFEDPAFGTRYSVKLEESKRIVEYPESDIIGRGFQPVNSLQLIPGQVVYVTHNHREMQGRVIRHDVDTSDVLLRINEDETVLRKIDEVRLLECRKSARLVNSDTDFSKLADVASSDKKKSKAIEVPRSDYVQIAGSRKRRTSENISEDCNMQDFEESEDEEVMTECSAALLLMKLSCSPLSPAYYGSSSSYAISSKQMLSPVASSSGASSFRSSTPSPPLSSSVTDEGIVKDYSEQSSEQQTSVIYQCTYPGCREERFDVEFIEAHVRNCHLNREPDNNYESGEEEFYYNEIEVARTPTPAPGPAQAPAMAPPSRVRSYSHSVVFDISLADHLDMARPPHEDPEFLKQNSAAGGAPPSQNASKVRSFSGGNRFNTNSSLNGSYRFHYQSAVTRSLCGGSPGSLIKSPRRIREGKKCRKVYGLDHREMWCTQCKWKKACARFGRHNFHLQSGNTPQSGQSKSTTSLLMAAPQAQPPSSFIPSSSAIKAIKF